jgi:hypothetical protein
MNFWIPSFSSCAVTSLKSISEPIQAGHDAFSLAETLFDCGIDDPMVEQRRDGFARHGVDRMRSNQRFDIRQVLISGIFCAGACP